MKTEFCHDVGIDRPDHPSLKWRVKWKNRIDANYKWMRVGMSDMLGGDARIGDGMSC